METRNISTSVCIQNVEDSAPSTYIYNLTLEKLKRSTSNHELEHDFPVHDFDQADVNNQNLLFVD